MEKEIFLENLERKHRIKKLDLKEFQRDILTFFESHGRQFPWRSTRNPYEILVSEVMLQQTQTERVALRYPLFLRQFPTCSSLAATTLPEVLQAWEGMGYYRRARNLFAAAQVITDEYGGRVPDSVSLLEELPGIGAYTARAIATFAYGAKVPFIETNIRTVYLHLLYPKQEKVSDRVLLERIEETLYGKDSRKWYYALMDLGVLIKQLRGNPNLRSKHHRTQSTFAGSKRQARAQILRYILKQPGVTRSKMREEVHINIEFFDAVLEDLLREEFLVRDSKGRYQIK
jgi:A/G-specific adenine glycosylase